MNIAATHRGDSANIAYYDIGGTVPGTFAEVLCAAIRKRNGKWRALARPQYYFTIRRQGRGELCRAVYVPREPHSGRLDEATVARVAARALRKAGEA